MKTVLICVSKIRGKGRTIQSDSVPVWDRKLSHDTSQSSPKFVDCLSEAVTINIYPHTSFRRLETDYNCG